jgi:CRP-like cAMP-binding protein
MWNPDKVQRGMDTLNAEKFLKAGEVIMAQGDAGTCAYFIQEGRVGIVVEKDDGNVLDMGTRGPGSIIGEMAIVDNQPRSATIRSLENCRLLEITKDDFARSVRGANPIVRLIAQVILMRYRDILRRSQMLSSDATGVQSPELQEKEYAEQINVVQAIKMANEFKVAIATGQLRLHYQPIISIGSGRILGFEALMRWQHPERGLIPPDLFIPMAEDSGLIIEASRWAVREVCVRCANSSSVWTTCVMIWAASISASTCHPRTSTSWGFWNASMAFSMKPAPAPVG